MINNDCYVSIAHCVQDRCSRLLELDISAGLVKFGQQLDVDKLQRGCPQLKVLRIMNCNLTPANAAADDEVTYCIALMTKSCYALTLDH